MRHLSRPLLRPLRKGAILPVRGYSQAVGPLVFDLHEPAKPLTDKQRSPILFLHGLFGSKKNNRGISKYVSIHLETFFAKIDNDTEHLLETWGDMSTLWLVSAFLLREMPLAHVLYTRVGSEESRRIPTQPEA